MIDLRRIMVPIDFSEHSVHALNYAAAFAQRFGSELYLLHIFQDLALYQPDAVTVGPPAVPPLEELTAAARAGLERIVHERNLGNLPVHLVVREGSPVEGIVEFAVEKEIDLVVLGTHGKGWLAHVLMGSTAEKVVRKAPCPVLTVRPAAKEFVKPD